METRYRHIELDEKGVPVISGTTTKVVELVVERYAYGWSVEELHLQHPHLGLGEIHSALAYYHDNREALDRDISARIGRVSEMQEGAPKPDFLERLREAGGRFG